MTKIPKPRSMRDKYGLSKIDKSKSVEYDLNDIGDGDVVLGYNRLKTRCSLHGKEHGKKFEVRKDGDVCHVHRKK